jgi:hypothetical protein
MDYCEYCGREFLDDEATCDNNCCARPWQTPQICRWCDGPLMVLGSLGRLIYYRCRDCGAQFGKED